MEKQRDIERLRRRISEVEAFDPTTITERFSPAAKLIETAIDETLSAVFGHGTTEYYRYHGAASLDHGPISMQMDWGRGTSYRDQAAEAQKYLTEGKALSIGLLRQAIAGLVEEIELEAPAAADTKGATLASGRRKVFVVHGHDESARELVARFLEKLELEAIILHEQADRGLTVIEKFEAYASSVAFAVALLTPDDFGGGTVVSGDERKSTSECRFRARLLCGEVGQRPRMPAAQRPG